ncbi:MAG: hypothetical protein IJ087_06785 [Eggerthellaceae bacterium]|nr:hypothetical protein [Eggerthellaceae bacterium]
MPNSIAFAKHYIPIIDEVYQQSSVSRVLTSGGRMVRATHNAREIMIPKISVSGLGDYTRDQGYKTGSINLEYQTRQMNYDRGVKITADVMDVAESGIEDCFFEAGAELQRSHVAPEADAFTFAQIAGHAGIGSSVDDFGSATATDVLAKLRDVTSLMDESQVTTTSRYLFITPTLKGVLDDYSYANPTRSNRVLERFREIVEVPQSRFYTAIDLLSGEDEQFGYQKAVGSYVQTEDTEVDSSKTYYTKSGDTYTAVASPTKNNLGTYYELVGKGAALNFIVVEKSAVIKYDRHIASRIFSPDELENLDSYLLKYRKYGIVDLLDNKLAGVYASAATA